MYIPAYSSVTDQELLKAFIQENSFGTLVTYSNGLLANHYPFLLSEVNEEVVLWTHLAKGNPQWKDISEQECLVIFTGPHAYISPEYYEEKLNVPTWNYTAVHAKCEAEIVSDKLIQKELMKKLVANP
jgi:transcriptional regulator